MTASTKEGRDALLHFPYPVIPREHRFRWVAFAAPALFFHKCVREAAGTTTATYNLLGYPGHSAGFSFRSDPYTNWQLSRIILTRSPASSGLTFHLGVTAAQPDVTVTLIGPPQLFATNFLPASIPPLSAYSGTPDSVSSLITVMLNFRLSLPSTPLFIVRDCPSQ